MYLFNPLLNMVEGQGFKGASIHAGIDYSAPVGTAVYAAADGIVRRSYLSSGHMTKEEGPPWSYGERIILTHPDGSETTYNHLATRMVFEGEQVIAGQQIGETGNTGYSGGPHLHFEYFENGAPVDPKPFLSGNPPPMLPEAQNQETSGLEFQGKIIVALTLAAAIGLAAIFIAKGA